MIQGIFETNVVSVTPEQTLPEVVKLMADHKIGDVIVVEGDKPCGIVTDRDIALEAFGEHTGNIGQLTVADVMTTGLVTVKESDWLLDVIDTMAEAGVVRLPVVDDGGKLVGVITDLHCMHALTEALDKVTHIAQKDTDESTPPAMTTDERSDRQQRQSLQ